MAKYEINSTEDLYQPVSGDLVLANKMGIIDEEEMKALESGLLLMPYMSPLNISDELSIDGKTILYAALTGSLDNHPDAFNFK